MLPISSARASPSHTVGRVSPRIFLDFSPFHARPLRDPLKSFSLCSSRYSFSRITSPLDSPLASVNFVLVCPYATRYRLSRDFVAGLPAAGQRERATVSLVLRLISFRVYRTLPLPSPLSLSLSLCLSLSVSLSERESRRVSLHVRKFFDQFEMNLLLNKERNAYVQFN